MFRPKILLAAAAALLASGAHARADLMIRVTCKGSGGSSTISGPDSGPVTSLTNSGPMTIGKCRINTVSLTRSSTLDTVTEDLALDFTYDGPADATDCLIVEYLSSNNVLPAVPVTLTTSASIVSIPGSLASTPNSVTLTSQVSPPPFNLGLPAIVGNTTGFVGTTTNTGNYVAGQPSSLTPPFANGATAFVTAGNFSFYQVFIVTGIFSPGRGTMHATASVTSVPEPATISSALVGLVSLGFVRLRRRKAVV